ncbi:hypothetical protein ACQP1W_26590 [Spirillospora sp. CA-255316]
MTRFEAVRVLLPDSPVPPDWGWRRRLASAAAIALAVALLVAVTVVLFELTPKGASRDPVTSAERFLHHIGHREYEDACTMAVDFERPDRPFKEPAPDYQECMGNLIWLGSAQWSRTDLQNARVATVRGVRREGGDFATVRTEDVQPRLPKIERTSRNGPGAHDILLALQQAGGKWYIIWPPP